MQIPIGFDKFVTCVPNDPASPNEPWRLVFATCIPLAAFSLSTKDAIRADHSGIPYHDWNVVPAELQARIRRAVGA